MNYQEIAREFKAFILKGNVVDLAVGVVIGAAFGKVVDSVVKDLITPLIGAIGGKPDFSSTYLGPVAVGNFINNVLSFLILGAVVFFLVVKPLNALTRLTKKKAEERPNAPTPLPDDVKLLMEIRDLLKGDPTRAGQRDELPPSA
jgi:large conductance mechanosensitive channel